MRKSKGTAAYILFSVVILALLIACSNPTDGGGDPPNSDIQVVGSISVISGEENPEQVGSSGYDIGGSITGGYYYVTGQNSNGEAILKEINLSTGAERLVQLGDSFEPVSAYPGAFILNSTRYLLFSYGTGSFALYVYVSEDDTGGIVYFTESNMWNFSNITSFVESINGDYPDWDSSAWISCPNFNVARNTLYFTLAYWQEDVSGAKDGDYIKIRVYESGLSGNTFQTPTETRGEIDPFDPSHYTDSQRHDQDDYPGRMGVYWIGRMYVTEDGNKAFFTSMNISAGHTYGGLLNEGDPYIAPLPNRQNLGDYNDIEDVYDPRLIDTFILSADIRPDGSFTNLQQLSTDINRGGVNYVCDISEDGNTLYVAHMVLDDEFWSYGWGPDGMTRELAENNPWDVEPWDGTIEIVNMEDNSIEPIQY
jgi:hypothetical protein